MVGALAKEAQQDRLFAVTNAAEHVTHKLLCVCLKSARPGKPKICGHHHLAVVDIKAACATDAGKLEGVRNMSRQVERQALASWRRDFRRTTCTKYALAPTNPYLNLHAPKLHRVLGDKKQSCFLKVGFAEGRS